MTKFVCLFWFPMDGSVRTEIFDNKEEAVEYQKRWESICYFIMWMYIEEWNIVKTLNPPSLWPI